MQQNGQASASLGEMPGMPVQQPATGSDSEPAGIDLAGWARGEAQHHTFDEVKNAIEQLVFDRYVYPQIVEMMDARIGRLNDKHDALQFCLREGLVDAADVGAEVDPEADADA